MQPDDIDFFGIHDEDLCGHTVHSIACSQCNGIICGSRIGLAYDGKPLVLCGRRDEAREVIAAMHERVG